MSSLIFVRDGRSLPFVPVTCAALAAIGAATPARRVAYARSLYLALLELANDDRTDRVAVSRKELGELAGCSRDLVSDLRPILEAAGVVRVVERQHGGQTLEHEWIVVEPEAGGSGGAKDRTPVAGSHDPIGHEPREVPLEAKKESKSGERARASRAAQADLADARQQLPHGFPDELRPHGRAVLPILRTVAEQHAAREVYPLAVGRVLMAHRRKPLVRAAHALAVWAVDPPRPVRDVVATYRTFLERERDLAAVEPLDGEGRPTDVGSGGGSDSGRSSEAAGRDWRTRERLRVMQGGGGSAG